MNKNVLIVLGGAVLVAVLVAYLVQISLGGKKTTQEPKVQVLVASKNLGIGTELKGDSVKWQEWPKASVFPGAVIREGDKSAGDALKGRLARDIASGEPVMKSALLGESKGNFVAASLEPGMRAVAIEVSASSMVGGFLGPGDFVDVMLTYKSSIKLEEKELPVIKNMVALNLNKLATETVLQNIKVLAVDQTAKRPEDSEKIKVGKTVTLSVTAHDAERLALAGEMGTLTLALRAVGDDAKVVKNWETTSDARMINVDNEIFTEADRMEKDAGINPNIVRIYNGPAIEQVPARSMPSSGEP